jgi:heme exporter protein B
MAMASLPLELVALVKIIAHWLTAALPLVICAPALGLLLNLDLPAYGILVATLILGTPAISAIAAIGAALTLRARKGGLLIALIVLPLYIPTLVFGIATVTASLTGPAGSTLSPILVLASISMAALVLAPWAAAAAVRAQTS